MEKRYRVEADLDGELAELYSGILQAFEHQLGRDESDPVADGDAHASVDDVELWVACR